MIILFVRHGHPNYANDCLTELGHEQAERAALQLLDEGIDEIYSSSCGRAYETAVHTANLISKDITKLDFMREMKWGANDGGEILLRGHPWQTATHAAAEGHSLMDESWTKEPPYAGNIAFDEVERISTAFDGWLEGFGYKREGTGYRVMGEDTDKVIALFSHGGSSSAVLSHLLNLPFFYFCGTVHLDFTSITAIRFSNENGKLINPWIDYMNDAKHIKTAAATYEM